MDPPLCWKSWSHGVRLDHRGMGSWPSAAPESWWRAALPSPMMCDVTLVVYEWPHWEYLHHGNCRTQNFPNPQHVAKYLPQHTTRQGWAWVGVGGWVILLKREDGKHRLHQTVENSVGGPGTSQAFMSSNVRLWLTPGAKRKQRNPSFVFLKTQTNGVILQTPGCLWESAQLVKLKGKLNKQNKL